MKSPRILFFSFLFSCCKDFPEHHLLIVFDRKDNYSLEARNEIILSFSTIEISSFVVENDSLLDKIEKIYKKNRGNTKIILLAVDSAIECVKNALNYLNSKIYDRTYLVDSVKYLKKISKLEDIFETNYEINLSEDFSLIKKSENLKKLDYSAYYTAIKKKK